MFECKHAPDKNSREERLLSPTNGLLNGDLQHAFFCGLDELHSSTSFTSKKLGLHDNL